MTMKTSVQAHPDFQSQPQPDPSRESDGDTRAPRVLFKSVSESSAAPRMLGVTSLALGGNPRLAVRAAVVLLRESYSSRAPGGHGARTHGHPRRHG